jgi:MtrB/PioB family decaheme-associated outer membrane protein
MEMTMRTFSPWSLLATLGALAASATSAAADVDTSQWKCESCPFQEEKSSGGTLDVGAGTVSDDSAKFGDYTGLNRQGGFLILGGAARYRREGGSYGSVTAKDLGLDTRAVDAEVGKEGTYRLQLGYAEIPRYFYDGAQTPFLGAGGSVLSLPAGFPAGTTGAMPLATTSHEADVKYKRSRLEAGLLWIFGKEWTTNVNVRHDVRDGTQRIAGSFFSTSAQLVAPVDQTTDQIELSASRFTRRFQFTVAYQGSLFRNNQDSLTWSNPFPPVVPGSDRGQLALAPDNQFHQIVASAGYDITPKIRASADVAAGRMTQNADYVSATLNPNLAVTLPATSLDGRADTFNGTVRLTAELIERLRLSASYARDVRDNATASLSYPAISTDMFLGATPRSNQPFSFFQDRYRLSAEYRGPANLRFSVGADEDDMERTLQEVVTTRETTLWGSVAARAFDRLSLSLRYAHADRDRSTYGTAAWVDPPENPLLRKFYLAKRSRDTAGLRADLALGERVSIGVSADLADDNYTETTLGLLDGRTVNVAADMSFALSEKTSAHAFAQGERTDSHQAGSQLYAQPDWWASIEDSIDVAGLGLKHVAMQGKLELGADYTWSRSHTDVTVDPGTVSPPFPQTKTSFDMLKLEAAYRVKSNLSIIGNYWYESYDSQDWHYDDLLPATVPNLLVFGDQPPHYNVSVVGLTLRWHF